MTKAASGFSLVEMLVVVAITSTLAIGATLVFARGSNAELGDAVFVQDVARVQRRAMLSGLDHRMTFGPDGWIVERRSSGSWQVVAGLDRTAQQVLRAADNLVLRSDGRMASTRIVFGNDARQVVCETGSEKGVTCAPR